MPTANKPSVNRKYIRLSFWLIGAPLGLAAISTILAFGIGGQAGWLFLGAVFEAEFAFAMALFLIPFWAIDAFFRPRFTQLTQNEQQPLQQLMGAIGSSPVPDAQVSDSSEQLLRLARLSLALLLGCCILCGVIAIAASFIKAVDDNLELSLALFLVAAIIRLFIWIMKLANTSYKFRANSTARLTVIIAALIMIMTFIIAPASAILISIRYSSHAQDKLAKNFQSKLQQANLSIYVPDKASPWPIKSFAANLTSYPSFHSEPGWGVLSYAVSVPSEDDIYIAELPLAYATAFDNALHLDNQGLPQCLHSEISAANYSLIEHAPVACTLSFTTKNGVNVYTSSDNDQDGRTTSYYFSLQHTYIAVIAGTYNNTAVTRGSLGKFITALQPISNADFVKQYRDLINSYSISSGG